MIGPCLLGALGARFHAFHEKNKADVERYHDCGLPRRSGKYRISVSDDRARCHLDSCTTSAGITRCCACRLSVPIRYPRGGVSPSSTLR